jgi:hypothetical protein
LAGGSGESRCAAGSKLASTCPFKALSWQDENGRVWLGWNDAEWLARRHGLRAASAPAVRAISIGASGLAMNAAGLSQP